MAARNNFKICARCEQSKHISAYPPTNHPFYFEKTLPICSECFVDVVEQYGVETWDKVDQVCRWVDVPFIPARWAQLYEQQGARAIEPYVRMFFEQDYKGMGWKEQQLEYERLKAEGALTSAVVPQYTEARLAELQRKWGANYPPEDLQYLEDLYVGVMTTQSVNGVLQNDQALKLCKLSLAIDSAIRSGENIDKLLGSYEKMVKIGEFTPKNVKNAQDFDSVGELFLYLEKTGFQNKFYDGVTKDIVDVTMQNIQTFCQRLYTQEPGIGEDIEKRIESLKSAKAIEDSMGLLDDYTEQDVDALADELAMENEEFDPHIGL